MLNGLLNEQAIRKVVSGVDSYNNPVITDMKNFNCRIEPFASSSDNGVENGFSAGAVLFCTEKMNIGDIVTYNYRNYTVTDVSEFKDIDGKTVYYEVKIL